MKKTPTTSMSMLIEAGRNEAKNVQEIKSVADTTENKNTEVNQESVIEDIPIQEMPETHNVSVKKGLSMLFVKREVKDSESVKIPRESHRELKILASMSGITMMQMIGNLIENFFEENQKEIITYKRKYLNGK